MEAVVVVAGGDGDEHEAEVVMRITVVEDETAAGVAGAAAYVPWFLPFERSYNV
jgi:hypothetical protein